MFPTKEAKEFFDKGYVFKKYHLDLKDPDNILSTYKIPGYPTFLILDGEGELLGQAVGGGRDVKIFTDKIAAVTRSGNTLPERYAKFESDPSSADEFIKFLINDVRMNDEADKVIATNLARVDLKEQLSEANMKTYASVINSIYSPTLDFFLKNKKSVQKAIGKERYEKFVFAQASKFVLRQATAKKFNQEFYDNTMEFVKKNKLESDYQKFVIENAQLIKDKEYGKLYELAEKAILKCDTNSRLHIISACASAIPKNGFFAIPEHRLPSSEMYLSILRVAYASEKNKVEKENYKEKIVKAEENVEKNRKNNK